MRTCAAAWPKRVCAGWRSSAGLRMRKSLSSSLRARQNSSQNGLRVPHECASFGIDSNIQRGTPSCRVPGKRGRIVRRCARGGFLQHGPHGGDCPAVRGGGGATRVRLSGATKELGSRDRKSVV